VKRISLRATAQASQPTNKLLPEPLTTRKTFELQQMDATNETENVFEMILATVLKRNEAIQPVKKPVKKKFKRNRNIYQPKQETFSSVVKCGNKRTRWS